MIDAALLAECAAPGLPPAVLAAFVERVAGDDPLDLKVLNGERVVLVARPRTVDEAVAAVAAQPAGHQAWLGLLHVPATYLLASGAEFATVFEPCGNVRLGTALFARVHSLAVGFHGEDGPAALEAALEAYATGEFQGRLVYGGAEPDVGRDVSTDQMDGLDTPVVAVDASIETKALARESDSKEVAAPADPFTAEIDVDLSRLR